MGNIENNNYLKLNNNSKRTTVNVLNVLNKKLIESFLSKWSIFLPNVLAFLVFINGLNGDFVHDDIFAIKRNRDVTGSARLADVFYNDFWGTAMSSNASHKSYRPLTTLTFRFQYWLHGTQPFYFHVFNVLLHSANTWLVMLVTSRVVFLSKISSILTGLMFAVHPVHVEAVTGIVGRADLMAAFFFLSSLLLYSKCLQTPNFVGMSVRLCLCLVLATAAMLSKENGITVVGVWIFFEGLTLIRQSANRALHREDSMRKVLRVAVTCIFTLVLLMCRFRLMAGTLPTFTPHDNPVAFHNNTLTRLLSRGYIWTHNFWLLLMPARLCYDWQHNSIPLVESVLDLRCLAMISTAAGFLYFGFKCSRSTFNKDFSTLSSGPALWSVVLMLVPFLPASNILFTVGFVLAERILYLPSVGFCIGIAYGIELIIRRYRGTKNVIYLFFTILIFFNGSKTWQQNKVWQSRETLFRSGVLVMPHNAKVHYNYGNFLKDTGLTTKAKDHYMEALRLDSDYASAHNNLGIILQDKSLAEAHFREALRLQPAHQGAIINLGNLLFHRGLRDLGLQHLFQALKINPFNTEALVSVAWSLMEIGNYSQAEQYLQTCLEIDPEYQQAHWNYGILMHKLGRHELSARHYMKVHELEPRHVRSLTSAANAYWHLKDFLQAETLLKQALSIQKDDTVLEQLAVLYYSVGRTKESLDIFGGIDFLSETLEPASISKILLSQNAVNKAEDILNKAMSRDVDNTEILVTLAMAKSASAKFNASIDLLTRAIKQANKTGSGDLGKMYFDRANNYKDIGQYALAIDDYKIVLRNEPNHHDAHGNIGAVYHVNGDLKKARFHYQKASELDPSNEIIKENLTKLQRLQKQLEVGIP